MRWFFLFCLLSTLVIVSTAHAGILSCTVADEPALNWYAQTQKQTAEEALNSIIAEAIELQKRRLLEVQRQQLIDAAQRCLAQGKQFGVAIKDTTGRVSGTCQ